MGERFDESTVNLVASRMAMLGSWHREAEARDVLDALADAGLLLLPGGETREEWGARIWPDGAPEDATETQRVGLLDARSVVAYHARMRAANPPDDDVTARRWIGNAQLIRRTVHTSAWTEVVDE